ncbi:MAG: efflux transporter periplasmic adaptor subunit [Micavibrio aeruginosavorus]|uniref:Efflux transporter periplasmic adaptor subunit n=1 Tax=Micavibrio aeruginosavorus TaxID=349221 RepID=A0A2W5FL94_9BACT|nr:MAG: efflux transporter periplasmic adaptor subunit [Micavibrio aeruginosavorus]
MRLKMIILTGVAVIALGTAGFVSYETFAGDDHVHTEEKYEEAGHSEEGEGHEHAGEKERGDNTKISDVSAQAMNIEVLKAGPATVHQTISLTGKIILNQDRTAQVRARFPGVIKSADKSVGDQVKKGDELATIESNQSLQTYSVSSPLDGMVITRNAAIGGLAGDEPVYVIADLRQLWAEFFVFSRDMGKIATGQKVDVLSLSDASTSAEAAITNLLPTAESSSQTVVARVTLDNADNKWRSGMTVRGDVVLSEKEVALAVKTSAIQRQEGAQVVYVKEGEIYEMRKVETGQSDREWTEIISGVKTGEDYVATNSFVVKADIGKSAAEHEH